MSASSASQAGAEASSQPAPKPNCVSPQILVLNGQTIHSASPNSDVLYSLSRGIASLGHATSQVTLERVVARDGDPASKPRPQHMYNLKHLTKAPGGLAKLPSDTPHYYIEKVSSMALGSYGLQKSPFRSQWKSLPLDTSGKQSEYKLAKYVKDSDPIFQFAKAKDMYAMKNVYSWDDASGGSVAVSSIDDTQHQLRITTELPNEMLDALVGLWCCHLWQQSADTKEPINEGAMASCKLGSALHPSSPCSHFLTVRRKLKSGKEVVPRRIRR